MMLWEAVGGYDRLWDLVIGCWMLWQAMGCCDRL